MKWINYSYDQNFFHFSNAFDYIIPIFDKQFVFQGFISYPRTETTAYPSNFDFSEALRHQQNDSRWKDTVKKVILLRLIVEWLII